MDLSIYLFDCKLESMLTNISLENKECILTGDMKMEICQPVGDLIIVPLNSN